MVIQYIRASFYSQSKVHSTLPPKNGVVSSPIIILIINLLPAHYAFEQNLFITGTVEVNVEGWFAATLTSTIEKALFCFVVLPHREEINHIPRLW